VWGASVAIHRLLQSAAFGPDDIEGMVQAYELALLRLGLRDRSDPLTEIVAKLIIDVAQTGEKEPEKICTLALRILNDANQSH
jgi:hypothetical protein